MSWFKIANQAKQDTVMARNSDYPDSDQDRRSHTEHQDGNIDDWSKLIDDKPDVLGRIKASKVEDDPIIATSMNSTRHTGS